MTCVVYVFFTCGSLQIIPRRVRVIKVAVGRHNNLIKENQTFRIKNKLANNINRNKKD